MFEARKLEVTYRVEPRQGDPLVFHIRLDEHGLLEKLPASGPDWSRIRNDGCRSCPHDDEFCRVALAIAPIVGGFLPHDSLETVRTRVSMEGTIIEVTGPVSQVVASLMGLCMAASGCSKTNPFRAMAIHHKPFSTLEDTVIRAAGFSLLVHWARNSLDSQDPFASLILAWEGLEEVNQRIAHRLRAYCDKDANLNGLANLDMFAKSGGLGLASALKALRPALIGESGDAI